MQLFSIPGPYAASSIWAIEASSAGDGPEATGSHFVLDWKYATGGRVLAAVRGRLDHNRLYVLSEDRRIYCLRSDGSLLWRSGRLPARPQPFLEQSRDGTLYLSLEPDRIAAYAPSGRPIWIREHSGGEGGRAQPIEWLRRGRDGLVYTLSDRMLTLRTHTGQPVWREQLSVEPALPPVVDENGTLWTVSKNGRLLRIDASGIASLAQIDELSRGDTTGGPGAIRCVADDTGIVVALGKKMWFFNRHGDLKWDADLYSPAEELGLDSERVYIRTAGRRIAAVARDSGEELWASPLTTDAGQVSAVEGHTLLVYDNRLLQLNRSGDGKLLASTPIPQASIQPLSLSSDQLIIGGEDWVVYSYRSPFLGPPETAPNPEAIAQGSQSRPIESRDSRRLQPSVEEVIVEEAGRAEYLLLLEELSSRSKQTVSSKNYPELLALLTQLSGTGVINPVRRKGTYINDYPEVRRIAVELLAENGTLASQEHFLRLLQYEWDPRVKIELIRAIGRLQSGLAGRVVDTLRHNIKTGKIPINGEPLMTTELISCLERVCRYSGTVRPAAGEILMDIYLSDAPRTLRMQAVQTLRALGSQSYRKN